VTTVADKYEELRAPKATTEAAPVNSDDRRLHEAATVLRDQTNRAESDLTRASTQGLEGAIAARFA
jgi:hypothetical protein